MPPTDPARLQAFYDRIRPMGSGWARVVNTGGAPVKEDVTAAFLCWFLGCVVVYGALFATGSILYGQPRPGLLYAAVAAGAAVWLFRTLPRVGVVR
jgi:SSS family solute:Na+ symporter